MPRRNEHTQLVSRNQRTFDAWCGEDHEPDINDAALNPLPHFLHRAFKKHHFHVRIRGSKTRQPPGEQTWADDAEDTAPPTFPRRPASRTLSSLFNTPS